MHLDIQTAHKFAGFIAACVVDSESGYMLTPQGGHDMDPETAAALHAQIVKSKRDAIEVMGLKEEEEIEDILITTDGQLHLVCPLEKAPSVYLYVALDKATANLGMARLQLRKLERTLTI